ncbi:MAG: hypothetical protein AB7O26_11685 [Planctomycetaceae bacterium]
MLVPHARWFFLRTPAARRRRFSSLRTVEVVEQRCLLSASSLIVRDAAGNPMDPEKSGIYPHQIFPPVPFAPVAPNSANSTLERIVTDVTPAEITKNLGTVVEPVIAVQIPEPMKPVVSNPAPSVPVTLPSLVANSNRQLKIGNVTLTFTVRTKSEISIANLFAASVSSAKSTSSIGGNLVESSISSQTTDHGNRKPLSSSPSITSSWNAVATTNEQPMQSARMTSAQFNAVAISSESTAGESRTSETPDQTMFVLAANSESPESVAATSVSTTGNDVGGPLPILEIDRFGNTRQTPSSAFGTEDQFQAALTTYFSNSQMLGRYDSAAAKPAVLPQTPERESDLVLTGKQGRRFAALAGDSADDFFRQSFKFLVSPMGEGEQQKGDENKPNVPGTEGNVDPGTRPQNGNDSDATPREQSDTDMKEGSLTWAGLLLAAASGFRSLRNHRKKQRSAAAA